MGEIAGVNTASLSGYPHSTKTRARWAEGSHNELNGHVFDLERDAQDSPCDDNTLPYHIGSVAARSTRTAPSAVHQDGGVKVATGASSNIRGRDNISIGTWNKRALRAAGKLLELAHEVDRYRWNILGLCEMRWKNFGETTTEEGHKVFFSGKEDKHEHGVGFLAHKDIVNTDMGCRPVSSKHITICLRAVPSNITIVQAYAPTSDYDDNDKEEFYDQLQNVIDHTPKKDILVVQGD